VQEVGGCLLSAACNSQDVVIVAESLDAMFDVFADDATDPIKHSLQLAVRLRPLLPQLKTKVVLLCVFFFLLLGVGLDPREFLKCSFYFFFPDAEPEEESR
jgi:hypothetical protein